MLGNELYHVISRTVGDTVVFKKEADFYRGIFSIYEFNNVNPVNIWERRKERAVEKKKLGPTSLTLQKRDMFVEILAFSFMPNHLHLLLRQVKDKGISNFMKKFGTGFAMYFNKKHNRRGHLFNKFKSVYIESETQLKNTFAYIHTNLISLIEPNWKENGIKNPQKVIKFLENNKRHSYPDYLGKKNFPSVTERDFILDVMGGVEGCRFSVNDWIIYKKEIGSFVDKIIKN